MRYVIDAARAGEALFEYMQRWQQELMTDPQGAALDFRLDDAVDTLCLRIANDPSLDLSRETREVRALLAARIMVCLANAAVDPEAEVLSSAARPTPRAVQGGVFGRLLSLMRLPAEWNGKPYPRET